FLLKTGKQGTIRERESLRNYERALNEVEHGGDYLLMAESLLPDGSNLRLYRKDYAKIWIRDGQELRARMAAEKKAESSAQKAASK
ncbi:MAG: hypothetical protein K2X27_26455, partial [Candidatus Obscuribacterales bacterium]|nr:hypothetical protein [Candidatus Obscuribacterales bacterium]